MPTQSRYHLLASITLIVCTALSVYLALLVKREVERDFATQFNATSDQIATKLAERLQTFGLVLRAGAGVFSATIDVGRNEWRAYVDELEPQLTLPGVQGIGFSLLLQPEQVAQHVTSVRSEGFPDYTLSPPGERELYTSIIYLEPFNERNQRAFGFDMYSEPVRRTAMEQARDTGLPILSGRVQLVQENETDVQAGTLMYFPVYNTNLPTTTVAERQAALLGWTYSPYRMDDLVNGILGNWQAQWETPVDFYIFDSNVAREDTLLFSNSVSMPGPGSMQEHLQQEDLMHQHRRVNFNGREWLLVFDGLSHGTAINYGPAWTTLTGGMTISLLLFSLLLSLTNTRAKAVEIATRLTAETLQHQSDLTKSEFRWKFAIEGSGDGLWDWNIPDNTVFFSPRWKSMLGYTEQDVGNSLAEWEKRIHPDDKTATEASIQAYLEGRTDEYFSEHRVRCKDGSYKWILDRGTVVNRSADGSPLRMIGTHKDITRRKQDELQLQEAFAEMKRLHEALDTMSAYVYMKKADYSYAFANAACLKLFGLSADSLASIRDEDLFPPDTNRRLREIDARVFAGENTREEVVVGSGADQRIYLEIKTPIYSDAEHKELWGLCGISTDITESKRMELELTRLTSNLQQAQRIAQMGSWRLDVKTGQIEMTPELFHMFGLPLAAQAPSLQDFGQLLSPDSFATLGAAIATTIRDGTPYELEMEITRPDGSHGWMLGRGQAVQDATGVVTQVHGIGLDLSERIEAKLRIEHLGRLYAALSACNAAILHCKSDVELFDTICKVVVDIGKMELAWIGLIDDDTGRIIPRHQAGVGTAYLDGIEISVRADDPHGRGATGTATRENHPVWVDNFTIDARSSPWHERAAQYGWQVSAALPVNRDGQAVGALTFYSNRHGWFDSETKALLEQMAHDISYALDKLDAEDKATRYQATLQESEQRFRSLVEQSFMGAFIIQNNRFVYVNPGLEKILGYPANGLAGMSLTDIVATKDQQAIAHALSSLASGQQQAMETFFTAQSSDGHLVDVGTTMALASYQQQPAIIGQLHDMANRKVAEEQIKRYAKNLEKVFLQTVAMATSLVEMRDPYTAGHEKHVAEIAMAIGREMQLPEDRIEGLRVGGYLHDVGKVMVPTEILAKPGRISAPEYALIKLHPTAGYEILKEVEFPWPVAQIALQHHERLNGSGYPKGLKGDEILLEARIIAVADVIESMASHRPYRAALGMDKALAEIENGRGTLFDPVVVDSCLRLFRDKGFHLPD